MTKRSPIHQHINDLKLHCQTSDPSLSEIFHIFGANGHYILIVFLVIPFLQPVPLFGLSTPFGILTAIAVGFAYLHKPPWLPRRWSSVRLPASTVIKICDFTEKIFDKISLFSKPRLRFLFLEPFRAISGVLVIFSAVLLALPLPIPFSNALPGWVIMLHALAYLEEDGVFVILSYVQTLLCLSFFIALALGFEAGAQALGVGL